MLIVIPLLHFKLSLSLYHRIISDPYQSPSDILSDVLLKIILSPALILVLPYQNLISALLWNTETILLSHKSSETHYFFLFSTKSYILQNLSIAFLQCVRFPALDFFTCTLWIPIWCFYIPCSSYLVGSFSCLIHVTSTF